MGRCVTPLVQEQRSRTDNVALAARILDGAVVGPGEEFSFNANLGRRTEEAGYKPARVIVDGRSEAGLAGGICQVSSTLYNAALLSGMEILERHPHSRPVPYLPMGLDATVSYGSLDLRWRNPWSFPVTVRAQVIGAGSELAVWIEGAEEPERYAGIGSGGGGAAQAAGEPGYTGRPVAGAPLAGGEIVHAGASGYRVRCGQNPGRGRREVQEACVGGFLRACAGRGALTGVNDEDPDITSTPPASCTADSGSPSSAALPSTPKTGTRLMKLETLVEPSALRAWRYRPYDRAEQATPR